HDGFYVGAFGHGAESLIEAGERQLVRIDTRAELRADIVQVYKVDPVGKGRFLKGIDQECCGRGWQLGTSVNGDVEVGAAPRATFCARPEDPDFRDWKPVTQNVLDEG
ncbi:MAG TPA: hypothetical protein PLY97_11325, partial [Acidocella sp.]|nr:hypothetical protein [Acidocella sp.]